MAKKGQGIMSKPPTGGGVRVSPGVYRDAKGNLSNSSGGKKDAKKQGGGKRMDGLNKAQQTAINQRQEADIGLGNQANAMMPRIEEAYANPYDFSQLPSAPVSGDFNNWRQSQIDAANQDFENRMNPMFKQQSDDFEQQMANRGIPMGSALYNQQKEQLMKTQNDQRQSMLSSAMGQAGQNAEQFFNVGTQARGNALNEGLMQRNMPLNEFNALYGARSGMDMQNLGYTQARGMANLQGQIQRSMPRGGGGGGGGAGPMWQQYGFSNPMEYDAYRTNQAREQAMWEWNNQPKGPKGPSAGSILGGQALGTGLALGMNYLMS